MCKPYFSELMQFVNEEYLQYPQQIFPPKNLIFNALNKTAVANVKAVIIGQDPYHGRGQANGLSFSVSDHVKLPPSLKNIFKELKSDLLIDDLLTGNLSKWADQGVLLLNSTLTVKESSPLSHHGRGWEKFTDQIVAQLAKIKRPMAFVLWGKNAQQKCSFLQAEENSPHLILTSAHPSPFAARRGFFGSRPFSKINKFLQANGQEPIDWSLK